MDTPRTSRIGWRVALAALYAAFVVFCVWLPRGPDLHAPWVRTGTFAFTLAPKLFATVAFFVLARRSPGRLRRVFGLLAAAEAADSLADLIFSALGYPAVSIADGIWLVYYLLTLAGLLGMPFEPVGRRERTILALDIAMVLASAATFTWNVVAPQFGSWAGLGAGARLNLVYPALDLLLLAAATALIQRDVEGVGRTVLVLLALPQAVSAAGMLLYVAHVQTGSEALLRLYFAERVLGRTILATAACGQLVARDRTPDRSLRSSRAHRLLRQSLPHLSVALALLALVLAAGGAGAGARILGVVLGTTLVTALLLFRQGVVMHENVVLYDELGRAHEKLASQAAALAALATVDGLTGIANRRAFDAALEQEWRRAARERQWLTLAILDIDEFKRFNDTYGHSRGDECLRGIAREIAVSCRRPSDLAARYGGEEFVLVLPGTDPAGARVLLADLLERIRALAIDHRASSVAPHVTVSAGAVSLVPCEGRTAPLALEDADALLYEAKKAGRDRYRLGETPPGP